MLKNADASAADLLGELPGLISAIKPAVIVSAIKMAQSEEEKVQTLLNYAVAENVR